MAFTEVKRERGRKKITLPSGDTIYIPVIISLTVRDQNGQETEHHYLNTNDALQREIHVDHLTASIVDADGNATSNPGVQAGSESIDVERIDTWLGLDAIEQAQESKFLLDNATGGDTHPPRFTTHQKTHVYRYYQDSTKADDGGIWVDSELIDEISVVDQNGQEWQYFLDNPFNEDTRGGDFSGQASPDDPDITDAPDLDPPYRTDPFQNLINFNGPLFLRMIWTWSDWKISTVNYGGLPNTFWAWTVPLGTGAGIDVSTPTGAALVSDVTTSIPFTYSNTSVEGPMPTGFNSGAGVSYSRTIIYKVTLNPNGSPLTFSGSVSGMDNYVEQYLAAGDPGNTFLYNIQYANFDIGYPNLSMTLSHAMPTESGPFHAIYQFDTRNAFILSGPAQQGVGGLYPADLYTWTDWFATAVFNGGISIQVGDVAPTGEGPNLAAWVEAPAVRTVTNVSDGPTISDATLKDYSLGLYQIGAIWTPTGYPSLFNFGGPPIETNAYTGTFP